MIGTDIGPGMTEDEAWSNCVTAIDESCQRLICPPKRTLTTLECKLYISLVHLARSRAVVLAEAELTLAKALR